MAVKTAAPAKKAATSTKAKAAVKTTRAREITAARKSVQGDSLECSVCGLVINVDEDCGCVEEHVILCCDEPMKPRKKKAAARARK